MSLGDYCVGGRCAGLRVIVRRRVRAWLSRWARHWRLYGRGELTHPRLGARFAKNRGLYGEPSGCLILAQGRSRKAVGDVAAKASIDMRMPHRALLADAFDR